MRITQELTSEKDDVRLPPPSTSFACRGVVIMPTVPTATSECAFLTATANGTYRNEREREGALRPTRRLLSPRETERGREGRTWYPRTTGIFCTAQLLPELTSTRSTPSFFSSSR